MAKIALFTGPEGHLSIAQAIQATLEDKHQVSVFYDRHILFNLYTPIYQFFPGAHKIPFTISKIEKSKKFIENIFKTNYEEKISAFVDKNKPEILISTFYMYNPALNQISKEKNIPFINAVSDPKTISPILLSEQAINVTFDEESTDYCQEFDLDLDCRTLGWFVKPDFEKKYDLNKVRKRIGLDADTFTLLISSGSEGTTMVMKLLPFLIQSDKPIQVIVACGSNKTLYKSVEAFTKMLSKIKTHTKIIPLSYVTNMQDYMQAADLVVGKAGPNSLFESVATQTPFFAITHIAGQEDGNLDIIEEYKLGYVEENPFKAQVLLQSILDDPSQLDDFKPHLAKMAQHNKQSAQKLRTLVTSLLK
jgi:UDP-N-acetylglucosamine:LPS N-acetylglucosamine transferase